MTPKANTGLTAGTKYEVQVQGVYNGTTGNWTTPAYYFTTFDGLELADNDTSKPDGEKNANLISANAGNQVDVMLVGRKLWKDGDWNTLCLPFDMTAAQVTAQLAPTALKELDVTHKWSMENGQWSIDGNGTYQTKLANDGTLYLYFTDANAISAGKPYIIKWAATEPNYIENPVFTGVTIDKDAPTEVTFTGGKFVGTYDYKQYTAKSKSILFLGGDNTLYYPQPDLTDASNPVYPSTGAFRAYFDLGSNTARAFRLNFDGESTGITTTNYTRFVVRPTSARSNFTNSDKWYSLDGRTLDKQPTKPGLYIHNGRKVAIK